MLGDHPINPVLLATDLAASRAFYHDALGLTVLRETDATVMLKCGGSTHIELSKSTVGTSDDQTQATWEVQNLRGEVEQLRARGVEPESYDFPGLKTEDGIADLGSVWAAWITDPGKNVLGIVQFKR